MLVGKKINQHKSKPKATDHTNTYTAIRTPFTYFSLPMNHTASMNCGQLKQ